MDSITIPIVIGEDRRLILQLPAEVPIGPADLIITPLAGASPVANPAREAARAKLLAAGALGTAHRAPAGTVPLSDEELQRLGQKAPGARSLDDLINEDRGEY